MCLSFVLYFRLFVNIFKEKKSLTNHKCDHIYVFIMVFWSQCDIILKKNYEIVIYLSRGNMYIIRYVDSPLKKQRYVKYNIHHKMALFLFYLKLRES